jgi:hypothetical protein
MVSLKSIEHITFSGVMPISQQDLFLLTEDDGIIGS